MDILGKFEGVYRKVSRDFQRSLEMFQRVFRVDIKRCYKKSEVCFKGMFKSLSRVLGKVQKELQGSFKRSLRANLSDFQGILKYTFKGFQVCKKVQRRRVNTRIQIPG